MQNLIQCLNKKFAEKEFSADGYRILFKRLASSVPEAWLYQLYHKSLEEAWRQNGEFDNQEFQTEDECKGSSEL